MADRTRLRLDLDRTTLPGQSTESSINDEEDSSVFISYGGANGATGRNASAESPITNSFDIQGPISISTPNDIISNFQCWFVLGSTSNYQLTGSDSRTWINISASTDIVGIQDFSYASGAGHIPPALSEDPYSGQDSWHMTSSAYWNGPTTTNFISGAGSTFHMFVVASVEQDPTQTAVAGNFWSAHKIVADGNASGFGLYAATASNGSGYFKGAFYWYTADVPEIVNLEFDNVTMNALHLFEYWGDGSNIYARIDSLGIEQQEGGGLGNPGSVVQINGSPDDGYAGYISEIITTPLSLSAAQVTDMRTYFADKYSSLSLD